MDNLQMTVLNLDGDDDFGPRFRHVPELEEEESTLRQPRSSEQSNYEVSDLREKLHTSHNTGACNDGTRRIRQRHHGLEIQIEADNPEDYQDRRILSYEESVEHRERGRREETYEDFRGPPLPIDYNNQHSRYSPERRQPHYDDGYNQPGDLRLQIEESYRQRNGKRQQRHQVSDKYPMLDRGISRNYEYGADVGANASYRSQGSYVDHYYPERENEEVFVHQRNTPHDFDSYRPETARSYVYNDHGSTGDVRPHGSMSDLIPQINVLPVRKYSNDEATEPVPTFRSEIIDGLPLPTPSRRRKSPTPTANQRDRNHSDPNYNHNGKRSSTELKKSKGPIALMGEDPFSTEDRRLTENSRKRTNKSSFQDFMHNKDNKSLAETRSDNLKSKSAKKAFVSALSQNESTSFRDFIAKSTGKRKRKLKEKTEDDSTISKEKHEHGTAVSPKPVQQESIVIPVANGDDFVFNLHGCSSEDTAPIPAKRTSRSQRKNASKSTSFQDFMNNKDSKALAETRSDNLKSKSEKAAKSTSFQDFMNNKTTKSLAQTRQSNLEREAARRANRSLSPAKTHSHREVKARSAGRERSPRVKSRSPLRGRSPKDNRGRAKSTRDNRDRNNRTSSPSTSRRPGRHERSRRSPLSPMRVPISRRPPPPPPRNLFAERPDDRTVVKEEIVDLAWSDEEGVGEGAPSMASATNDRSRRQNPEICAYCRQEGHNIVRCPTVKCQRCGNKGHIAMVCNSEEINYHQNTNDHRHSVRDDGNEIICRNCDLKGHIAKNCPFKESSKDKKKSSNLSKDQAKANVISIDYHHLETQPSKPVAKPTSTMYTFIENAKGDAELAQAMMFTWNLAGHDQDTLYELMQKKSPPTKCKFRLMLVNELSHAPAGDIPWSVSISELLDLTIQFLMPEDRINLLEGKINISSSSSSVLTKPPSEKKAPLDTSQVLNKLQKLLNMIDLQVGPPNSEDRQRFDWRLDELEPLKKFIYDRMNRKASEFAVSEEYVQMSSQAIVKVLSACSFGLQLMRRHLQNYGEESFTELLASKLRYYEPHLPTGVTSAYVSNFIIDFFDQE